MKKLIRNKAQCKNCKDIIESIDPPVFIFCGCYFATEEVKGVYVSGGLELRRIGGCMKNFIDLSEYEEMK